MVCTSQPPPPKKRPRKGDTSGKGLGKGSGKGVVAHVSTDFVPFGSSSRDSRGTVPISVHPKVCQERSCGCPEEGCYTCGNTSS